MAFGTRGSHTLALSRTDPQWASDTIDFSSKGTYDVTVRLTAQDAGGNTANDFVAPNFVTINERPGVPACPASTSAASPSQTRPLLDRMWRDAGYVSADAPIGLRRDAAQRWPPYSERTTIGTVNSCARATASTSRASPTDSTRTLSRPAPSTLAAKSAPSSVFVASGSVNEPVSAA